MDVRSSSLSRRAALTGLGGVALLAAAACSPSIDAFGGGERGVFARSGLN